jgi:uncharacterized membrane protein YeiB
MTPTTSGRRDLRVDAVRGVALVSMYLAHCAPTAGATKVLTLTEYATYPLFALLVGIGAELGSRGSARRWWVGPLVRGAVLLAAAEVLDSFYAQVYIVLAFLGVLTWLAAPLARAGSVVVGAVGLVSLGLAPPLNRLAGEWTAGGFPGGDTGLDLVEFLVIGGPGYAGPYQVTSMVFFASVGILLARHVVPASGADDRRVLGLGVACALAAAVWLGLHEADVFDMRAYDVTYRVLLFDGLLVVAITLLVVVAAGRWRQLATPLAAMGAMSLTLYSLQILWLDADLRVLGHAYDDTWLNVAVLVLGSLAVALGWRAVVRAEPWRRGPVEGPVALVVTSLSRPRDRG